MTGIDSCIGIDPGGITGICFLDYLDGRLVGRTLLQVDPGSAAVVLKGMLHAYYQDGAENKSGLQWARAPLIGRRMGAVEKFVEGRSAGTAGKPAQVTRQLVMELTEVLQLAGYQTVIWPAGDVKPWASNKRLVAAQIATETEVRRTDFRHAYDGARHALYRAHQSGIVADPLRKVSSTS